MPRHDWVNARANLADTPRKATATAGSAGYHFDVVNNSPTRRFDLSPGLSVCRELGGESEATFSTVVVSVGRMKEFGLPTKATPCDLFEKASH
jgi:hypothetical protein